MIAYHDEDAYEYAPSQALIFHEPRGGNGTRAPHGVPVVLTSHPILASDAGPVIGAGQAVSAADQERLLAILVGNRAARFELLPAAVLAVSSARLLWHLPPVVRPMLVRTGSRVRRLKVPWPSLVALARERELWVTALAGDERPCAETPLFHAPLGNVYDSTAVCTGSAVLPRGCEPADLPGWEAVIYETAFTHVSHPKTLNLPGHDDIDTAAHFGFWQRLAAAKAARFPTEALVPLGRTLKHWMEDVRA